MLPLDKIQYNFPLTVRAHIVRPPTVQPCKRPYKTCTTL